MSDRDKAASSTRCYGSLTSLCLSMMRNKAGAHLVSICLAYVAAVKAVDLILPLKIEGLTSMVLMRFIAMHHPFTAPHPDDLARPDNTAASWRAQ
eukprot:scaffold13095_cov18-Tisochrysis_lutea.AAC.1